MSTCHLKFILEMGVVMVARACRDVTKESSVRREGVEFVADKNFSETTEAPLTRPGNMMVY